MSTMLLWAAMLRVLSVFALLCPSCSLPGDILSLFVFHSPCYFVYFASELPKESPCAHSAPNTYTHGSQKFFKISSLSGLQRGHPADPWPGLFPIFLFHFRICVIWGFPFSYLARPFENQLVYCHSHCVALLRRHEACAEIRSVPWSALT